MKKLLILMLPFIWLAGCDSSTEKDLAVDVPVPEEQASELDGTKEAYLSKLDEIEDSLKEFDKVYESGTQADMNQAKSETFKRWDEALNEIYDVLKEQLTESDFEDLKKEQEDWIVQRDQIAEEKSQEAEGGTLEPFLYASALADLTKERCYELVNKYMK
ncbi:lysozyme inhibitor LprI family protein [Psychrobacillus sp. FSL K6-4046]|uniref:lysozyme inhibitor LprI family protein n=1 Tax=Psychrobacillus sp. FSL K6-4046 TaxID=2921550 RepID=UPI002602EF6F|nr:lysozyme inhibitor LprI family protein [uncultured Psychrobacillus sp.]